MRTIVIALFCLLALSVAPLAAGTTDTIPANMDVAIADGDWDFNLNWATVVMDNWDGATTSQGLVQFDLGLLDPTPVTSATLSLWHAANAGPGKIFDLYRNTAAWDADTVTFTTAPPVDPTPVASLAIDAADDGVGLYRMWDVTALVQGWMNGTLVNFGVTLRERNEVPNAWVQFSSTEVPDQEPLLTVTFADTAAVPEPGTLAMLGGAFVLLGLTRRVARRR